MGGGEGRLENRPQETRTWGLLSVRTLVASTLHWIQHLDTGICLNHPSSRPIFRQEPRLGASDGACIGEAIQIPLQR